MFRNRDRSSRGQTMVEFALILPILMFLLTGFFDLGRVVLAHDALGHAAREAARYAIVHGGSSANPCPVGPPHADAVVPVASASCPYPSPSKESIRIEAREQAAAAGSIVTVEVCYGAGCTGDTDTVDPTDGPATNERGTPVTVTVRSTVHMAAASLLGVSTFDVASTSTMLVNH
jgi:Flp pilus assembly protein TadG